MKRQTGGTARVTRSAAVVDPKKAVMQAADMKAQAADMEAQAVDMEAQAEDIAARTADMEAQAADMCAIAAIAQAIAAIAHPTTVNDAAVVSDAVVEEAVLGASQATEPIGIKSATDPQIQIQDVTHQVQAEAHSVVAAAQSQLKLAAEGSMRLTSSVCDDDLTNSQTVPVASVALQSTTASAEMVRHCAATEQCSVPDEGAQACVQSRANKHNPENSCDKRPQQEQQEVENACDGRPEHEQQEVEKACDERPQQELESSCAGKRPAEAAALAQLQSEQEKQREVPQQLATSEPPSPMMPSKRKQATSSSHSGATPSVFRARWSRHSKDPVAVAGVKPPRGKQTELPDTFHCVAADEWVEETEKEEQARIGNEDRTIRQFYTKLVKRHPIRVNASDWFSFSSY